MEKKIVMIAAGMFKKRKNYSYSGLENIYLNYGLLGLASNLKDKGYDAIMFQGDSKKIDNLMDEIEQTGVNLKQIEYPIFVSVPSFWAVQWAIDCIYKLKEINTACKVILGGRWILDQNSDWAKKKFPQVDFFSYGCPDDYVESLLDENNWEKYKDFVGKATKLFSNLNYSLLNNYKQYQPVIEANRGCGNKCDFCVEKDSPSFDLKKPNETIDEIKKICHQYNKNNLNIYFEASAFLPTEEWAKEFMNLYLREQMSFKWRFCSRVDRFNKKAIKYLSKAGLKVIDFGFESASIQQLNKMKKTTTPKVYLQKAEDLFIEMDQHGIWAKLNIMLYIGENKETINETVAWLELHKKYIKGIAANPFTIYLKGDMNEYLSLIEKQEQIKINHDKLFNDGYTEIDLSSEIDEQEAKRICEKFTKEYMTFDDYLDLKKICYIHI